MSVETRTDTYKCPKCKAVWRIQMQNCDIDDENFALIMGMSYDLEDAYCPRKCRNVFGFRVKAKKVKD